MVIFNSNVKLPEGTFGVSFISATWIIGREHVDFSPFKTCRKSASESMPIHGLGSLSGSPQRQLWGEPIWVMWNSNCFVSFPNSARLGSMESPFWHISNHIYILYAYIHTICIYIYIYTYIYIYIILSHTSVPLWIWTPPSMLQWESSGSASVWAGRVELEKVQKVAWTKSNMGICQINPNKQVKSI